MATITGLTADRMQQIIDKTIVSANIVGGHLILTLTDGSTVDAGVAQGPSGVAPRGTAFPGSPADGDPFIRTDMDGSPLFTYSTEHGWVQVGGGGGGLAKVTAFPSTPADGDVVVRTDLNGSPMFAYSTENGWEQQPRMGAVTVPSVRAYASAAPTALANNTFVAAALNSEEFDTDSMHDTVTNTTRITIKTPGIYLLRGFFSWLPSSSGSRWIQFNKNGTLIPGARQIQMPSASAALRMSLSTTVRLVAGDYIELMSLQDSGAPLDSVDPPYLEATWLGGPGQTVDERGVPAFSANNLANQSIPGANVATKLALPSVAYDTDNCFDTTNSRFVVKTPGLWNLSMLLPLEDNSSQWLIRLYKNGARYRDLSAVDASTALAASPYFTINTQVLAAAGDYFELFMFNNPSGSFNVFGGATEYGRAIFSGSLVASGKTITPYARVYPSADITLPSGTLTAIPFNSERGDNDSIHDTASNTTRLTCRTAGVYAIEATLEFSSGSSVGTRQVSLLVNGSTVAKMRTGLSSTNNSAVINCSAVVELAVGDYVEAIGYQDSGSTLSVFGESSDPGATSFAMVKVGAPNNGSTGVEVVEGVKIVGSDGGATAFSSTWAQLPGTLSTYTQLRYYKDRGRTYIEGNAQTPAAPSGATAKIFTLPVGYRPAGRVRFNVTYENETTGAYTLGGRIYIDPDGSVYAYSNNEGVVPANQSVDLSGISFRL